MEREQGSARLVFKVSSATPVITIFKEGGGFCIRAKTHTLSPRNGPGTEASCHSKI